MAFVLHERLDSEAPENAGERFAHPDHSYPSANIGDYETQRVLRSARRSH